MAKTSTSKPNDGKTVVAVVGPGEDEVWGQPNNGVEHVALDEAPEDVRRPEEVPFE